MTTNGCLNLIGVLYKSIRKIEIEELIGCTNRWCGEVDKFVLELPIGMPKFIWR